MALIKWINRIANLFRRSRMDREIERELAAHIEMRVEDNIAAGMSAQEARRDALLRFGNPAVMKERTTAADAALTLENISSDLRYAFRQLRKSPGFALTVIATLALGIGANLAVFQLLHGVMFAQLPITRPDQLYSLHAVQSPFDEQWFFSYAAYQRLQKASATSAPVIARSGIGEGVFQERNGFSNRASFQLVSGNFFSVLGVSPFAGRLFTNIDDRPEQNEWPVVLRYGYARERFGLDSSLVGRHAVINGVPVVIVGIAAEGFSGVVKGSDPDIWLPIEAQASGQFGTWFDSFGPGYGIELGRSYQKQPGIFWLWVLARVPDADKLASSIRWTAALQPDLALIAGASKDAHTREKILHAQVQLVSASGGEGQLGEYYSKPLMLLMTMAGIIFLVGCLNLANLQLARLMSRQREIALRISLGATRWRVLRQVLVEDLLLALLGGLLALATGRAASELLLQWASGRNRILPIDLHIGLPIIVLGAALLIGSLIAFSLLPAWWITSKDFAISHGSNNSKQGAATQSRSSHRWSSLLLAAQVSLSVLLVGMAAMLGQTLVHIAHTDAGMDRGSVLAVHLDMRSTGFYKGQPNLPRLYRELVERIEALPGVQLAAVQMCSVPNCGWNTAIHVFGQPETSEAQLHGEEDHVGPGYFHTLGIPVLQGREFSPADRPDTPQVAILNHAYAKKFFGDRSPIGHWIGYGPAPADHRFLIVGEVGDALVDGLRFPAPPVVYMSIDQNTQPIQNIDVRTRGSIRSLPIEIRESLHAYKPDLPITEIVALDTEFDDGLTTEKLLARLTEVFGALSLALAALGFYGLLSFRVTRRTSEIGIRMALGASRAQVQMLIFRQTFLVLFAGILPGIALTEALARMARSVLYGTGTTDPLALVLAVTVLIAVALCATFFPARRAASVEPMQALRAD